MPAKTFADVLKFNPYHDSKGRFASADAATSFTYAPGKSTAHDNAIQRAKDADAAASGKGFKGTLYHGSPATDIEEFDMSRAGSNTSSGEKLLYFTDSKQMAEDFSYERLEGSTKYFQRRGKKGRVYEVDVEMKNPLDFRNLSDKDIDNILKLDIEGVLTKEEVKSLSGNHQLLKTNLDLRAESLKKLGYDGLIANTGKAGHYALEYAVVDSNQATIRKGVLMKAMTFDEILKFNPYHDSRGRFSTADAASQVTIRTRDPGKQYLADRVIAREKEREAAAAASGKEESPQMKAIHEIEDQIRNQDYESAACVDKDGDVLFFKDGEQSQVEFNWVEVRMMRDNILTHNHPSSSMFSKEDVDCWLNNDMQEIRATNRLGITYSLSRGENFDKSIGENFAAAFRINRGKALTKAQQTLDDKGYPEKIFKGEITIDQANAEFRDIFNAEMIDFCTKSAPSYGINFSIEKRDVGKSAGSFVFTAKATDDREIAIILDKEGEAEITAAFDEWLNRAKQNPTGKSDTINPRKANQTTKSIEDSRAVLFIGLQISGADSLAIEGGEDTKDFHVTLAYGHFDARGDEDDTSVRVQHAIDDIRDLIPDTIKFDATGRFEASESSDGKDVIYAQVAAGQLEKAHDGLLEALKKHGINLEGTFPEYKPHMTLAYIDPGAEFELKEINASGTATKVMIGHGWESTHEHNYTIAKMDDDKRLVFGWASISFTADGEQLEDLQHDLINPEDLEEAVYEYVLNFRDTGEEHRPHLRKKGKLVESCVFTAEKQKAMGLPEGILPVGWWIGFKIEDDEAWEKVKNGTYRMFSIEGKAQRVPVEKAAPIEKAEPERFDHIQEFDFP